MIRRQPQRIWRRIRFSWIILCMVITISSAASDYYNDEEEYVDDMRRQQEQQRLKDEFVQDTSNKETATLHIENERKERVRLEREAQIEAELAKLDEEARKKAKRQKRKDARLVKTILKHSQAERHYAVLGLRNNEIVIGPVVLFGKKKKFGPIRLFHLSTKQIRRAYRNRALLVHPDKNLDGRAQEAFVAVEGSASLLSDETKRTAYDNVISAARKERRQELTAMILDVVHTVRRGIGRVIGLLKGILGPFATPIFVLGGLMTP